MRALSFDLRHRFNLRYVSAAAGLLLLALGTIAVWRLGPLAPRFAQGALDAGYRMSASAGFALTSIQLTGRHHADKAEILDAVGVTRGGPILAIDPKALRARLEAIDWIDQAQVRRTLPDRLEIELKEAQPIAIWQNQGNFALIDSRGRKITEQGIDAFAQLPLVVGEGAPEAAAPLFAMLDSEPNLKNRVMAAIRVGDRRWNIRFDNDVDLLLPEFDAEEAWHRFARLESEHRLLARAITAIDMRLKDRLVVRLSDEGLKTIRNPGRNT
jgi:cell division protein FtsQ